METLRPRATRRLRQTLSEALDEADRVEPADVAVLLGRISALAHEVRFLIYAILVRHEGSLSAKAIAALSRQRTSTVLRNLHMLIAERLVEVEDDGRGGRFFAAGRDEAAKLAAFFSGNVGTAGQVEAASPSDRMAGPEAAVDDRGGEGFQMAER